MYNGVTAGCVTGGALAVKAGPQAAAFGCAGFAAVCPFSRFDVLA